MALTSFKTKITPRITQRYVLNKAASVSPITASIPVIPNKSTRLILLVIHPMEREAIKPMKPAIA